MGTPAKPVLEAGKVYRTRDLAPWGANPPRLAQRLVDEGQLVRLAHGLFAAPKRGRFGVVPPSDEELMRGFLGDDRFVFTGPERWNALGLGTTAMFARRLVYNTKRSGRFKLGGREFLLQRVAFPDSPTPEWFVVDLLEHANQAASSPETLATALVRPLRAGTFARDRLLEMSRSFGTRRTRDLVQKAVAAAAS